MQYDPNNPLHQLDPALLAAVQRAKNKKDRKESLAIYPGKLPPYLPFHERLLGKGGFWQDAYLTERLRDAKAKYEKDHAEDLMETPEATF